MVDVFEGSKLTLHAWVERGKGERKKAKFEFEQTGGAATVEAQELELGDKSGGKKKVSTTVTVPDCKDDEPNYVLQYKVTCKGKSYPGKDYKVWPSHATFKATNKDDGSPFEGVILRCSHSEDKELKTDAAGQCPLPLKKFEPFSIHVVSPFRVEKWVAQEGRIREAEVIKLPYKATFLTPDVSTAEDGKLKWWTNLPDKEGAPQGSRVKVRVGAVTETECIKGRDDTPVHVQVQFGKENSKRNDPKPALYIEGKKIDPDAKGVCKGVVQFTKDGDAPFEVEVGVAGGDETTIKIGVTEACEDEQVTIVNWRKLWYQASIPEGADEPDLSRMVKALEEVFVAYEKHGDAVVFAKDEGPKGSWFPGEWLKEKGKLLNIGNHNKAYFHGKFVDDKTPLQVHVCCTHTQYDAGSNTCKKDVLLELDASSETNWSDGKKVKGKHYYAGSGFFPKSLKDGGKSIISGSWESDDGKKKGDLEDADFWITDYDNHGWLRVKLPDEAKTYVESGADKKVSVKLKIFVAAGPYLGEADGAEGWKQLIVVRAKSNVINDVMAHELGHTMNQVTKSKPPGMDKVEHGRRYTANGHQGPHCADGMSDANYAKGSGKKGSDYEGNFRGKKECTCIMYGENGDNSTCNGKFCPRCAPFIKGEGLTTLH